MRATLDQDQAGADEQARSERLVAGPAAPHAIPNAGARNVTVLEAVGPIAADEPEQERPGEGGRERWPARRATRRRRGPGVLDGSVRRRPAPGSAPHPRAARG